MSGTPGWTTHSHLTEGTWKLPGLVRGAKDLHLMRQGQSDLTHPLQMCLLCCHLSWAPGHLGESEWIVRWDVPHAPR